MVSCPSSNSLTLLPKHVFADMGGNLDLAFASFHRHRDKLQTPCFSYSETGTHGVFSISSAPYLDSDIHVVNPKCSTHSAIVEDKELTHIDQTIRRTLPLLSTYLSTEAVAMSVARAQLLDKAHIRGAMALTNDKFQTVMDLLSHRLSRRS